MALNGSDLSFYRAEAAKIFDVFVENSAADKHRTQRDDEQGVIDAELRLCDRDAERRLHHEVGFGHNSSLNLQVKRRHDCGRTHARGRLVLKAVLSPFQDHDQAAEHERQHGDQQQGGVNRRFLAANKYAAGLARA
jgi:hypothetical protein